MDQVGLPHEIHRACHLARQRRGIASPPGVKSCRCDPTSMQPSAPLPFGISRCCAAVPPRLEAAPCRHAEALAAASGRLYAPCQTGRVTVDVVTR